MANTSNGPVNIGFVNAQWYPPNGYSGAFLGNVGNYASIAGLRGALSAKNAAYYTEAKLNEMTVNDMVFALRNVSDPTTIADYMSASQA